ncbi:MAG: tetratricopeptide repeat protein [Planctomycetaceae bacterium]|nr:tetratricopeptide repeat protein [Planctomycetaceae bacterium]
MIPPMEPGWTGETTGLCESLQADLSSLVDGELDERAAPRAIAHLEVCAECRGFFDEMRAHVHLHQDLADADGLLNRFAELAFAPADGAFGAAGQGMGALESRLLVHKLATVFYQLGKAYVLTAIDEGYRQRVFEPAVSVERERSLGRGFIDGVAAASGQRSAAHIDWREKRHVLNGTLERLPRPEDKARRLLEECLEVESDHESAHIYLALLDAHEGKVLRASRRLEELFRNAIDPANRGHAATQLGRLLGGEGDYRGALVWYRWILKSGLADEDQRFAVARFNAGVCYAHLGQSERALSAFRAMLDRHPTRAAELAEIFRQSPVLRATIDRLPGFTERLLRTCPELFRAQPGTGGPDLPDPTRRGGL